MKDCPEKEDEAQDADNLNAAAEEKEHTGDWDDASIYSMMLKAQESDSEVPELVELTDSSDSDFSDEPKAEAKKQETQKPRRRGAKPN